jgi:threonine dehydratase
MNRLPDMGDVVKAYGRLKPFVRCTPLLASGSFGGWLKLENLQWTGAYKVRGALNALLAQVEQGDHRPVVAASAGNHSAGVAWAAAAVGLSAITVLPRSAPEAKKDRTRRLGAHVVEFGDCFEAAFTHAQALARERNWRFLHAFDDPDVIAGQGTVGLEVATLNPDVVLVPIGGGGLASGIGLVGRHHGFRVVGVQVEQVDAMRRHLSGVLSNFTPAATVADGTQVIQPGQLTARLCRDLLDEIVLVSEAEVVDAMRGLATREHVVAEGAGALAVAAMPHVRGQKKVAIVSGGNVDLTRLATVFSSYETRCPG